VGIHSPFFSGLFCSLALQQETHPAVPGEVLDFISDDLYHIDMKLVRWVGDSLKRVRNFPVEVRHDIGSALFDIPKKEIALIKQRYRRAVELERTYHNERQ
jgi:hypothetical protein